MRAKAPERVLLRAQLAEVEAIAVDVIQIAQLPLVEQLLQPVDRRVVLEQMADHQDLPRPLGGRDRRFGLGGGRRERLLDKAVLA